jgi:hypothetical protein
VGQAAETWDRFKEMLESGDLGDLPSLYDMDAIYLEPYNPPHRGNLLIQAYLKDYLSGKDEVTVDARRVIEAEDSSQLAVEWTISYTAGGRRWNDLPRASFFEFGEDGQVVHHRDYT